MEKKMKRFVRPTVRVIAMESSPLMLEASANGTISGKVGAKPTFMVHTDPVI